jgi:hypothetical protein
LVTEVIRNNLDPGFALVAMPAVVVKGIAGPVITYAVQGYAPSRPFVMTLPLATTCGAIPT